MAKKAKDSVAPVMAMEEISKLNQAQAVDLFIVKTTTASRAYLETAKLILHIKGTLSRTQTIHGLLGKKGVKTSTINNAMQAVRVWESLVERSLVTEAQFDKLGYWDFVHINAAIKLKGVHNVGPLVAAGDLDEVEFIEEHKMTSAEKKAADAAEAAKKAAQAPVAPEYPKAAEVETPTPEVENPAPVAQTEPEKVETPEPEAKPAPEPEPEPEVTNIVQMPDRKASTLADGEALLESLANVFGELNPEEFLVLSSKLIALANMVVDQESAIKATKKAA